jgi:hypothetical protein
MRNVMDEPREIKEVINYHERKCAKCGKLFIAAPFHVFRANSKWYCKWTCYNHRNDKEEKQ